MKARLLLNLALLLLVLLLAAAALLGPDERERAAQRPPLTSLTVDAIDRILLERRDGKEVILERRAGQWRLIAPFSAPANRFRVENILRLAESRSLKQIEVAEGTPPARYGLAEPRVVLHLNDTALRFGDTTPLDQYRYVAVGERLHLVSDTPFYNLTGPATGFVSYRLLPPAAELVGIELPDLTLRRAGGGWKVEPDAPGRTADAANAMAAAWRDSRALQVRRADGEPPEKGRITLHLKEGPPLAFHIRKRDPELVLLRPDLGLAYHLPPTAARELLRLPSEEELGDAAP